MTTPEILKQLEAYGSEQTRKIFNSHGASENRYGVKVADLKKIVKQVKKNHQLALELYDTGNADAMYLAGLIADEKQMTKADLQRWAEQASWYMISEYTVAWVAAESAHGLELALEWIESDQEKIACAGWSTLSGLLALTPDDKLDLPQVEQLMERVKNTISSAPNRVRYTMNNFIIAVGCWVVPLTPKAKEIALAIGPVAVEMGGTACKVPLASEYIQKAEDKGRTGKKKKTVRC
ncbi:MAG: DNA alkylation repair protein [Hymenobacteraceae bacterium]|nr:DNA alkylation repair protein [Hymenobacteraceae bacterium]MDX5395798.1 DNA alkylation repair protein [Hymenobacteraceae bacterium]MDX5511853.1 DNA alkylation repair protein [Hymenobacteraceae bacterium]